MEQSRKPYRYVINAEPARETNKKNNFEKKNC